MTSLQQPLPPHLEQGLLRITGARAVRDAHEIQRLWSGYGSILRCSLAGGPRSSVIAKHIRWPSDASHPRGWSSDRGHARKVRSYRVERSFYEHFAARCRDDCRVPAYVGGEQIGEEQLLVLEDLDGAGFPERRRHIDDGGLDACLRWLAAFHAAFVDQEPTGLWPVGTYWHLDTRPDELAALDDPALIDAAPELDRRLRASAFSTLVHGDAKIANFCFSSDERAVAAVDFQYVGGGCGMKDLAYFVSSCFDETECERREQPVLDAYFAHLRRALGERGKDRVARDIEADWRPLYPLAWTDFYRFLKGWSPGHWKLHSYSERVAREVVASL